MALGIYPATNLDAYTQGGTFSPTINVWHILLDGREGGSREQQVWVRNDSALYYYTGITVQPIDANGPSMVDGTSGYSWKLKAQSLQPSLAEWNLVTAGASASLTDIGSVGSPDTSTYFPLWVRIEVPKNAPIKTASSVSLRIVATQTSI